MPHWLHKVLTYLRLMPKRVDPDPHPGPKVYLEDEDAGVSHNEFDGIGLTDSEKAELGDHFKRLRRHGPR